MIGTVFGHYRVTQKLGQGGVGDVWKAIDLSLDREVALKVLRPELAAQPDVVARFRAEALALAKLNHPNIATIHGFHVEGACPFMAMEYVHGQTLHTIVRGFGRMPLQRSVPLFLQVLDGIQHAHEQGIVHRDLKASNVMLSQLGVVKVLDFGIARRVGSVHLTRGTHAVGTPAWMAPEQVRGEDTDVRTDVYALGLLLYWLLVARLPFEGENEFAVQRAHLEQEPPSPRAVVPELPRGLEQAILRALAKQRTQRWASVAELRAALGEGYEPEATRPQPLGVPVAPARWRDADEELTQLTDEPSAAKTEELVAPTRVLPRSVGAPTAEADTAARGLAGAPTPPSATTGRVHAPPAALSQESLAGSRRVPEAGARTGAAVAASARAAGSNPTLRRPRWVAWAAAAVVALCVLLGLRAASPDDRTPRTAAGPPPASSWNAAARLEADAPSPALETADNPSGAGRGEPSAVASADPTSISTPAAADEPSARAAEVRTPAGPARPAARKPRAEGARKDDRWVIRRD